MKRFLLKFIFFYLLFIVNLFPSSFDIKAKTAILQDFLSGEVLYEKEPNLQIFPAELEGKAQRGGSFLCNSNYCHGFRLSARSATSPESSLFHVGFRCVKNITK